MYFFESTKRGKGVRDTLSKPARPLWEFFMRLYKVGFAQNADGIFLLAFVYTVSKIPKAGCSISDSITFVYYFG